MSDLSRSLPEAAWSEMAGPAWRNVTYADLSDADPDTVMSGMKARVDRTVAAVLEKLIPELESLRADGSAIDELTDRWRQAAAEIREGK